MTPLRLAADLMRASRLRHRDPPPRPHAARPERLVVTLTTVPERVDRIRPTLRSLLDQTCPADRILLAWPKQALRSKLPYPHAPDLPPGIELLPCEDIGPASKLLPALRAEPTALLVAVDDDVIYPYDFLETLLAAYRADPKTAWAWRGAKIEPGRDPRDYKHIFASGVKAPTDVDVLMGTWGYLIPPQSFDDAVHDFAPWPPEVRWTDDIWISGHLARRGVKRRVMPGRGLPLETGASSIHSLNQGPNQSGETAAISFKAFAPWW